MSLGITYGELRREVGRYLGFGSDPDAFELVSADAVDDAILNGLREAYFGFFGAMQPHEWSFLKRQAEITLANGVSSYDLPSDFVRIASSVTIDGSDYTLRQIGESEIRSLASPGSESGDPTYIATLTDGDQLALGVTKYRIQVHPVPSESGGVLRFWYLIDPAVDLLSGGPLGGAMHAKTILQCCLAQAEISMNLESLGEQGPIHGGKAIAMLQASIDADLRLQGMAPRQPAPQ